MSDTPSKNYVGGEKKEEERKKEGGREYQRFHSIGPSHSKVKHQSYKRKIRYTRNLSRRFTAAN